MVLKTAHGDITGEENKHDLLLITTYIPVLGLISRSVSLITLAHLALSMSAPTAAVLAMVLLLTHADAQLLQRSSFDRAAGFLHPVALSLVAWLATVRCSATHFSAAEHWVVGFVIDIVWILCACVTQAQFISKSLGAVLGRVPPVGAAACLLVRCAWSASAANDAPSALEHMARAMLLQALLATLYFTRCLPAFDSLRLPFLFVLFAQRYLAAGGSLLVCAAAWCASLKRSREKPETQNPVTTATPLTADFVPFRADRPLPTERECDPITAPDEHSTLQAELRRALRSV